jgi:thiol-disulfide isomerase/thioredoxin
MAHPLRTRRDVLATAMALGVACSTWPWRPAHALRLADRGPAPEFAGVSAWLGSPPLTMAGLRDRVVLIDFWTHTCSNWQRTVPYLNRWRDAYRDKGLVIVGVHTPEFSFEHERAGVEDAIARFALAHPVVQDNDYAIWRAWRNQYWPAHMLVDKAGRIVLQHFGEGDYAALENAIRQLTGVRGPAVSAPDPDLSGIGSPEMYFGLARQEYLAAAAKPRPGAGAFSIPARLPLNRFALAAIGPSPERMRACRRAPERSRCASARPRCTWSRPATRRPHCASPWTAATSRRRRYTAAASIRCSTAAPRRTGCCACRSRAPG